MKVCIWPVHYHMAGIREYVLVCKGFDWLVWLRLRVDWFMVGYHVRSLAMYHLLAARQPVSPSDSNNLPRPIFDNPDSLSNKRYREPTYRRHSQLVSLESFPRTSDELRCQNIGYSSALVRACAYRV